MFEIATKITPIYLYSLNLDAGFQLESYIVCYSFR